MNNDICKETGKVTRSQAKAERLKISYDDIKRCYYCDHCEGYHITSVDSTKYIENNTNRWIKNR